MKFSALPFIVACESTGQVTDTWSVTASADYEKDCAIGRSYFRQLNGVMQMTGNPLLLQRVVEGMIKKGNQGAIETGFLSAMALEVG